MDDDGQQHLQDSSLDEEEEEQDLFGGFEAQCIDNALLYKVCHMAGDLLDSANIVVSESGISIQTIDQTSAAVLLIDIPSVLFDSYRCEGEKVAHVNMETLVGALRKTGNDAAKFVLTIRITAEDRENMLIEILDKKTNNTTKHKLKLWKEEKQTIFFRDGVFDRYHVVSSANLFDEINDLSRIIEPRTVVTLEAGNDFKMTTEAQYGDSAIVMEQNVSRGYRVVQKQIDISSRNSLGHYDALYNVEGLKLEKYSTASTTGKKRKKQATKTKRKVKTEEKDADDDDEDAEYNAAQAEEDGCDDDESEEVVRKRKRGPKPGSKRGAAKTVTDVDVDNGVIRVSRQDIEALGEMQEDSAEKDLTLSEKNTQERIEPMTVPLSLQLLKSTTKGLRLSPETYVLIKENYPVIFLQTVQQYGRILVALAPQHMTDNLQPAENVDAMESVMAAEDEND